MFILILFLCVTQISSLIVPSIAVDRSDVFNSKLHEFESRRLYVDIVDTVSYPATSNSTVNIALHPSYFEGPRPAGYTESYEKAKLKLPELLGCTKASEDNVTPETYYTIAHHPDIFEGLEDANGDGLKDNLLNNIARHSGAAYNYNITRDGCSFRLTEDSVFFQFRYSRPLIRSGWIVERHSLGDFYSVHASVTDYEYQHYRTNYSYIDGNSGEMFDVSPKINEIGKRIWEPTSLTSFEWKRLRGTYPFYNHEPRILEKGFTFFRETETGVLVATLSKRLILYHNSSGKYLEESIDLDGNFYHVRCYRRKNEPQHVYNASTNVRVEISIFTDDNAHQFKCHASRDRFLDVPEVVELEQKIVHSSGRTIPSSKRNIIGPREIPPPYVLDSILASTAEPLIKPDEPTQNQDNADPTPVQDQVQQESTAITPESQNESREDATTTGNPNPEQVQEAATAENQN